MDAEALQSVCSLCGFRGAEPFPKMGKEYSLVRCRNCGVVRLGPIPPENELATLTRGIITKSLEVDWAGSWALS